jgi:hypothetical protein
VDLVTTLIPRCLQHVGAFAAACSLVVALTQTDEVAEAMAEASITSLFLETLSVHGADAAVRYRVFETLAKITTYKCHAELIAAMPTGAQLLCLGVNDPNEDRETLCNVLEVIKNCADHAPLIRSQVVDNGVLPRLYELLDEVGPTAIRMLCQVSPSHRNLSHTVSVRSSRSSRALPSTICASCMRWLSLRHCSLRRRVCACAPMRLVVCR